MTAPVLPDAGTDPTGYVLAVADLRERRAKAVLAGKATLEAGGWLVEQVDGCTCGSPNNAPYPHEPHCGWEPQGQIPGPLGEFLAAERPAVALAEVALWRGVVGRHEAVDDGAGDPLCRACYGITRFPCPDRLAVVAACQAYAGGQ